MSRKLRVPKEQQPQLSDTELWVLSDGVLGVEPDPHSWELFMLKYPTQTWASSKELWKRAEETVMQAYISERPGHRPAWWWHFSAPRMSAADLAENGWDGSYYAAHLCDPRRRLSGTGTPNHEVLAYAPLFAYGLPDTGYVTQFDCDYYNGKATDVHGAVIPCRYQDGDFDGVPVDPANPPTFESEATYLERHGLLVPGEKKRLRPEDYLPVTATVED